MLKISRAIVALIALIPIFAFAQVLTEPEMPKAIQYSKEYNIQVIKEVFGKDAPEAIKIAFCESSHDNLAVGDGGWSGGLFQIYTKVHTEYTVAELKNPVLNAQVARRLFVEEGWRPWTCKKVL